MSKRTLAILLIVIGGAAILGILIWTFYPAYQQYQANQPPALPNQNTAPQFTATSTGENTVPKPNQAPSATTTAAELGEQAAQDQLKQRSLNLAGRFGSYSNLDQFESLRTATIDANAEAKKYIETQRADLIKAHPSQFGSWGQTTRALSARITAGAPIAKAQSATVVVQAQVTVQDSAKPDPVVSYQEITMQLVKVGDQWQLSRIEQKPFQP